MIRSNSQKSLPALGFLTVTDDGDQGLFGGYLILNLLGRPLEFHCTAPVRPNRAQAILYGPTLDPYLYGERIAQTLMEKGRAAPKIVLTDCAPVLAARPLVETSLVWVLGPTTASSADGASLPGSCSPAQGATVSTLAPQATTPRDVLRLHRFAMGEYEFGVLPEYAEDQARLAEFWPQFAEQIELHEPFGRIRDAIDEARAGTR